jgi:hypothetical protein
MNEGSASSSDDRSIGLALSGGGHRATVWALGAMTALVDAGMNGDVVSISSVSGGSIANGLVAHHETDYRSMSSERFHALVAEHLPKLASSGLFFVGRLTEWYITVLLVLFSLLEATLIAVIIGFFAAGEQWSFEWFAVAGAVQFVVLSVMLLRKDGLFGAGRTPTTPHARAILQAKRGFAVASSILLAVLAPLAVWVTGGHHGGWALLGRLIGMVAVGAIVVVVAMWWFSRRGDVVRNTLAKRDGDRLLGSIGHDTHHVFCATELQTGDHIYLSQKLVSNYRFGVGIPGSTGLATAVQSSACLPGAFPPRRLSPHSLGWQLRRPYAVPNGPAPWDERCTLPKGTCAVVDDGGVYDNMAEQWEAGWDRRAKRLDPKDRVDPHNPIRAAQLGPAKRLIVVNAGKSVAWKPLDHKFPSLLTWDALGVARDIGVLYDVSTSNRRSRLWDQFHQVPSASGGTFVHIATNPNPKRWEVPGNAQGRRDAAAALLESDGVGVSVHGLGAALAQRNPALPTTLAPLGTQATLEVFWHAYLLTRVGLHVDFAAPLPTVAGLVDLERDIEKWTGGSFAEIQGPAAASEPMTE